MTRRVFYDYDDEGNFLDLPDRPVCLVKDWATKMFGDWTTEWADSGVRLDEVSTKKKLEGERTVEPCCDKNAIMGPEHHNLVCDNYEESSDGGTEDSPPPSDT